MNKNNTPQHRIPPLVLDLQSDLHRGKLNRREFLHLATLLGVSVISANILAGCTSPSVPEDNAIQYEIKRGRSIKIGSSVVVVDHPARLEWLEGANQLRQVYEYLTETSPDGITRPGLLERWETDDAVKTWTFYLRQGITFSNGQPLTTDDIIFNFEQWLDPDTQSSMRTLLASLNRTGIEKIDDYTMRLHLNQPEIGFPAHLFHYPAMILPRTFEGDFLKHPFGSGPYIMTEYKPGEKSIFKRRPDYWRMGIDNQPLPYLDELIYFHLPPDERLSAMAAGAIDMMHNIKSSDLELLSTIPELDIKTTNTSQAFVIRMRVDEEPWQDVRVRQALKLCQDRNTLLARTHAQQGEPGIDAHVAPVHPAYCQKSIPAYNPDKAKALLAEAGYPNGLKVTLTTKNDRGESKVAQVLKELAREGGFDIELNIIDPVRYRAEWRNVNFGITDWAHRPLGTMNLALGYTVDENNIPGIWNETHWIDEPFIALLREAQRTFDVEQRRTIMCKIEDIMQERGPIGISYWRKAWTVTRAHINNVQPHPSGYEFFDNVWRND